METVRPKGNNQIKMPTTIFMTFGQFLDHDMTFTPHATCKQEYVSFCFLIKYIFNPSKRGSRGAAHVAKSLRWSVKLLLKYLIRATNISAYINIHV